MPRSAWCCAVSRAAASLVPRRELDIRCLSVQHEPSRPRSWIYFKKRGKPGVPEVRGASWRRATLGPFFSVVPRGFGVGSRHAGFARLPPRELEAKIRKGETATPQGRRRSSSSNSSSPRWRKNEPIILGSEQQQQQHQQPMQPMLYSRHQLCARLFSSLFCLFLPPKNNRERRYLCTTYGGLNVLLHGPRVCLKAKIRFERRKKEKNCRK